MSYYNFNISFFIVLNAFKSLMNTLLYSTKTNLAIFNRNKCLTNFRHFFIVLEIYNFKKNK